MFKYNPKANYQPNEGRYLQILSGKDLYKQTIVEVPGAIMILSLQDFRIFLLIILWGKCVLGINCGRTGTKPIKIIANTVKLHVVCASSGDKL